jgi:hypothetical protein
MTIANEDDDRNALAAIFVYLAHENGRPLVDESRKTPK